MIKKGKRKKNSFYIYGNNEGIVNKREEYVLVVAQSNGTKVLGWAPQFTCIMGQEYPAMGGPKDGNVVFIGEKWKFFFISLPFSKPYISREHHNVFDPSL